VSPSARAPRRTGQDAHPSRYVEGPRPRPLSYWRRLLAATGGTVPGPDGERHPVSLARWDGAGDEVLLAVHVEYRDPDKVGTTDPEGPPRP
jgi:hypothetical protein